MSSPSKDSKIDNATTLSPTRVGVSGTPVDVPSILHARDPPILVIGSKGRNAKSPSTSSRAITSPSSGPATRRKTDSSSSSSRASSTRSSSSAQAVRQPPAQPIPSTKSTSAKTQQQSPQLPGFHSSRHAIPVNGSTEISPLPLQNNLAMPDSERPASIRKVSYEAGSSRNHKSPRRFPVNQLISLPRIRQRRTPLGYLNLRTPARELRKRAVHLEPNHLYLSTRLRPHQPTAKARAGYVAMPIAQLRTKRKNGRQSSREKRVFISRVSVELESE